MFHHCLDSELPANPSPESSAQADPNAQPAPTESPYERDYRQVAVLGLSLIASSEEIGNEMALRSLGHILQYCDIKIKRAVPSALALLNISNPKIQVMDLLTKLSHDQDEELSFRAILGLGLIGAGTNNARLAGILRQLAGYYGSESSTSNHLYLVRIAQGLLHMGKGKIQIKNFHFLQ